VTRCFSAVAEFLVLHWLSIKLSKKRLQGISARVNMLRENISAKDMKENQLK